jgi:hypothetical protein
MKFFILSFVLFHFLPFTRVFSQEAIYGFYWNHQLRGYLKKETSPQLYEGKDAFEVRRVHYTRFQQQDRLEQIQAVVTPQGELLEISKRIRIPGEDIFWTGKLTPSGDWEIQVLQGIKRQKWMLSPPQKLFLSFQSYLWLNPQLLNEGSTFQLAVLELEFPQPQIGEIQVSLGPWISLAPQRVLRFKQLSKLFPQLSLEGTLDEQGELVESRLYHQTSSSEVSSKDLISFLEKASPALIQEFGSEGIRIPLGETVYGEIQELEVEGLSGVLPFPSPYLSVERQERETFFTLKSVSRPYREDSRQVSSSFKPEVWERLLRETQEIEPLLKRCSTLVARLQEEGISARVKYGFYLEQADFSFHPWLEVDRGEGWEPYDLVWKQWGTTARYFYPGILPERFFEFLGKSLRIKRVVKEGKTYTQSQRVSSENPERIEQVYWGLSFQKPPEVDQLPSLPHQMLFQDALGSCLILTPQPFSPENLNFEEIDFYLEKLLKNYKNTQMHSRAFTQIHPNRKAVEVHYVVLEEQLHLRILLSSRGSLEGLLIVFITREEQDDASKKWFQRWLTSLEFY